MALPKQPVSLFFGATNQDVGKKSMQLGDLTTAQNTQQIKGGEFSKRFGFTQVARTYTGQASLTPDSMTSPDGVQVLTRDAATDHVFARSSATSINQDQGHADRFVPSVNVRFPAAGSGYQQAPMAKQAGNYVAWLISEGAIQIAQVNPTVALAGQSRTADAETVVQQQLFTVHQITPTSLGSDLSTKIKSFALIDHPTFDANNLWLLWVDWSGSIFSAKFSHTGLTFGGSVVAYSFPHAGTIVPSLTSICAGMVDGSHMAVAVCGVRYETASAQTYEPAATFRTKATGSTSVAANVAQGISAHFYLSASTGQSIGGTEVTPCASNWATTGGMTAAACSIASVAGGFQTGAYWYYAFVANWQGTGPVVVLEQVTTAGAGGWEVNIPPISIPLPATSPRDYGIPVDWDAGNSAHFGWFYNGQIAVKETATGVDVCVTVIPYYITVDNDTTHVGTFRAWNPDYLFTECWSFNIGAYTWTRKWKKLGCCVAQGWMRMRNFTGTLTSGTDYLLTTWEDKEALQTCYHVREWETGEIIAQVAYGAAAHVGHTATRDLQAQAYCSDVQQPMLSGVNQHGGMPLAILVGLQSANQNACVDVATVTLEHWDFRAGAKPIWPNPAEVMGFALAPGPIPTVMNGFQTLREAGPLVYPSRPESYLGSPGS
jgi:hypothetical protein